MSCDTWPIVGYGIEIDDIYEYFNKDKIIDILETRHIDVPDPEELEECIYDEYGDFAGFVASLDETEILDHIDDGNGHQFVLFPPCYPWWKKTDHNELKTKEGVEKFIANILIKVCDISAENVNKYIHYVSTTGWS